MNYATKNLENDHVHILRLIDIMEAITHSNKPDVNDLETIVNLIRNYADGFHHEKEERMLFPLMAEKGFSLQQGPVAVMLNEHTQGRNFVKGMSEGIEWYKNGKEEAISYIFENMCGYITLLRSHIAKENNVLFRMADKVLIETDHQNLMKEFLKVENSNVCGNVLSGYIASIGNLEKVYLTEISK